MADHRKHFISAELRAPNVMEVDVAQAPLAGAARVAHEIQQHGLLTGPVEIAGLRLYAERPRDWGSDIRWLSQVDPQGFAFFQEIFDALGLAAHVEPYVRYDKSVVLYSGFFVARSHCEALHLHTDWIDGDNDGFTFLSPLTENCGEIGLVYRNLLGRETDYRYRLGKGLVFGDHFHHSTGPGKSAEPSVLLCFNFGTDRMENWDKLSQTTAYQGVFHRRPDGEFITTKSATQA
jgi:hypothetical protein